MKTLALLLFVLHAAAGEPTKFHVIRQWKYLNFTWPSEEFFRTSTSTGLYVPENIVVAGVKYFEDHFYLTLPRMKSGVPATLARIKAGPPETSPRLEPFPSWEMNAIDDCINLQNVQNVEIDPRGQMWIIDGGRIETLTDSVVKCSPKLVIFDIKSNRTNTVYVFPEEVASKATSFLYDIVVDSTDGGYAYITDNSGLDPGIIVYSVKENRAWKVRHPTMKADPAASQFTVNGVTISTPINIAGIALGPRVHATNDKVVINEARDVYYCPLSSHHLFAINTTVLRNENLTRQNYDYTDAIRDVGTKPSQSVGMVMDNQGILYYGLLGNNAIGRWDSHTPFDTEQRLIARDDKYIEWPNSFALDQNGYLTVLVNRLNRFIYGKFDLGVYNFRLISASVGDKSYLYDEDFHYDSGKMTTMGPVPAPEPEPTTESQQNVTGSSVEKKMNGTQSAGSRFVISLVMVVLSAIFFLA